MRGLDCCQPLAAIVSDDLNEDGSPVSFSCLGSEGDPDKLTDCFVNSEIDDKTICDRRYVIDRISVYSQGLSAIANGALD
ncbi:hypothetical protein [Xenococcus sp. PCC 7305]|uniref:hypothetical protein n=1 Tax=Xenococcus sp. PCC 7305 TaxID=102125 RepID=UPI000306323F|nr:hypothetical protein [Xenococcus sp. PCC 7305]